jgi:hypothetical protein
VIDGLRWHLGVFGNLDRDTATGTDGRWVDHAYQETVAEPDK